MKNQDPKEMAQILALKRGMALILRSGDLYGIYPDGEMVRICHFVHSKDFWVKVCLILTEDQKRFALTTPYMLHTPNGIYAGKTVLEVLRNLLLGRTEGVNHE